MRSVFLGRWRWSVRIIPAAVRKLRRISAKMVASSSCFCAFDGPPKKVRLHGRGTLVTPDHARFAEMASHFPANPGTRAFVHVALSRVPSSCGYGMPLFDFRGHRDRLDNSATNNGPERLKACRANKKPEEHRWSSRLRRERLTNLVLQYVRVRRCSNPRPAP